MAVNKKKGEEERATWWWIREKKKTMCESERHNGRKILYAVNAKKKKKHYAKHTHKNDEKIEIKWNVETGIGGRERERTKKNNEHSRHCLYKLNGDPANQPKVHWTMFLPFGSAFFCSFVLFLGWFCFSFVFVFCRIYNSVVLLSLIFTTTTLLHTIIDMSSAERKTHFNT